MEGPLVSLAASAGAPRVAFERSNSDSESDQRGRQIQTLKAGLRSAVPQFFRSIPWTWYLYWRKDAEGIDPFEGHGMLIIKAEATWLEHQMWLEHLPLLRSGRNPLVA